MYDPHGYRHFDAGLTRWDRLCEGDLAPFVPWIGAYQVESWNGETGSFWGIGLEERLSWLESITFLLTDWGVQAEQSGRLSVGAQVL